MAATPLDSVRCSRRTLLAASAAGMGALLVGCTSSGGSTVTPRQADQLAAQVGVQEALVAAFATAAAADAALGATVAALATQAQQQLARLKAAAPRARSSAGGTSAAPPAAPEARAWLHTQVTTAADSHANACLDQIGVRAALLGSIAAGLRGMAGQLA